MSEQRHLQEQDGLLLQQQASNGMEEEDEEPQDGLLMMSDAGGTTRLQLVSLDELLFFGCGLGSSICYISTLSSLVYFMMEYGPNSFIYLNVSIYIPLLPISLIQARWDQEMDKIFRSYVAFFFRGTVAFLCSIVGTLMIPLFSTGRYSILITGAVLQGIGGAILLGILNQMASFVTVGDNTSSRLKAAVSAGVQASALVVLLVTLITGFGTEESNHNMFVIFFLIITVLECVCFAIFLMLMILRPPVRTSMMRRDTSISNLTPLLNDEDNDNNNDDENGEEGDAILLQRHAQQQERDISYRELFQRTSSGAVTLVFTLVPSFLVGSWFTHVQTGWMQLPQILFYTRIGSDLCGRIATILVPPCSMKCLCITSVLRWLPVTIFFINAATPLLSSSAARIGDALSILLVASIAFLSGYLVTGTFQLAPDLLPTETREANATKQASLLNVAYSFSALMGLLTSITLITFGF